jgi:predicted branched-subunit amino acid permease
MGYGALAKDSGLDLALTLFINAIFFALPAQVVLVDQIARGAALGGAAFAVALTAIRLLPMTVSLIPLMRNGERLPRFGFLAVHFVAISVWVDGTLRLPYLPPPKRLPYFLGMGLGMMMATLTGSTTGYILASSVPPTVSAALLFMSPTFFWLSQVGTARLLPDWLAIGLGCVIGPLLFQFVPGLDLLLAGLIGGTIAFIVGKRRQ